MFNEILLLVNINFKCLPLFLKGEDTPFVHMPVYRISVGHANYFSYAT